MEKKYELLTDKTIELKGRTLYRIRALRDVGLVKAGSIGGYVESENNLSHFDDCWIYNNAKVYGGALVSDKAKVLNDARVYGDARVCEDAIIDAVARVFDNALVRGRACVTGQAMVCGFARISENAYVSGNSRVFEEAWVSGRARITKSASVHGEAQVYQLAMVSDHAHVFGKAHIFGNAKVFDKAQVAGYCLLSGEAYIACDASLGETSDYLTIGPIGSENGVLTAWRDAVCGTMVNRGCFIGSLREFEIKVMARHDDNIHGIMYGHAIAMIKAALA